MFSLHTFPNNMKLRELRYISQNSHVLGYQTCRAKYTSQDQARPIAYAQRHFSPGPEVIINLRFKDLKQSAGSTLHKSTV